MHKKKFNTRHHRRHLLHKLWWSYQLKQWNQQIGLRLSLPQQQWPRFVKQCRVTTRAATWLQTLDFSPCRTPPKPILGRWCVPQATYVAAFLIKIDARLETVTHLHTYLRDHPALIWGLGFPLVYGETAHGFDGEASLPTTRHFNRVLRELSSDVLQQMLTAQVKTMHGRWSTSFGDTISLDTKHILAWVRENNPKAYIKDGRFDKEQQPAGDADCKVGCKRRHNRKTPAKEGISAEGLPISKGEFYWGYATGAVVTKVPEVGEFVLAEMTQTFDKGDTTYFFPLMKQVEERLGFRPTFATADAAFDAFYVYDYFHNPETGGFAAVPFSQKGGKPNRSFDEDGHPLCEAGLSMALKLTYNDNTTAIIPYRRQKYVCPLLHPDVTGESCPIQHKRWPKGGCTTTLAELAGSRIRHQLERESEQYQKIYAQRTAVERLFSRAKALGMERPKLRNYQAIANQNTLIYIFINARTLQKAKKKRDNSGS